MLSEAKKDLLDNGFVYLKIKVIPGAPKTEIKNIMADGTIKIAVAAAPERGRANIELLKFLSAELGVPKNSLALIAGAVDRIKLVKIRR
jgi:uncharacterized protein YggU (UPF0235/DUF167 family)